MIVRGAGAVLLFLMCAGLGCSMGQIRVRRMEELGQLIRFAEYLKGEISYARTPLPEALQQISSRLQEPFSLFLSQLAERMGQALAPEFSRILEEEMEKHLGKTCLQTEDLEALYQAVGNLGYLDKEMQIRLLEYYLKEENRKREQLKEELPGQRRMYEGIGILGGIFLVILLI